VVPRGQVWDALNALVIVGCSAMFLDSRWSPVITYSAAFLTALAVGRAAGALLLARQERSLGLPC